MSGSGGDRSITGKSQSIGSCSLMHRGLPRGGYAIVLLTTILGSTIAFLPTPVFASSPACGDTIIVSTTLSADLGSCSGIGLAIGANNIVLNCAGHTITGAGQLFSVGVLAVGSLNNVTVVNCHVTKFYFDMNVGSTNSRFVNNLVDNAPGYGFFINSAMNNHFINNKIVDTGSGMLAFFSNGNLFVNNNATANGFNGITMASSSGNLLTNNFAKANSNYGFEDDTTGSGTAGTANVYLNDRCVSNFIAGSSPTGLCKPQP